MRDTKKNIEQQIIDFVTIIILSDERKVSAMGSVFEPD